MPPNNDTICVESHYGIGTLRKLSFAVTFDSGDGSFADHTVTTKFEGYLLHLQTNPGSTSPTDQYDITIEDADGLDVLRTLGTNRHTTNEEVAEIVVSTYNHPAITQDQVLTLKIANQSVNSALTRIDLVYSTASD